jgi:hypothetical protein
MYLDSTYIVERNMYDENLQTIHFTLLLNVYRRAIFAANVNKYTYLTSAVAR